MFPQLVVNRICQYLANEDLVEIRRIWPKEVDHYVIWIHLKRSPIELWLESQRKLNLLEEKLELINSNRAQMIEKLASMNHNSQIKVCEISAYCAIGHSDLSRCEYCDMYMCFPHSCSHDHDICVICCLQQCSDHQINCSNCCKQKTKSEIKRLSPDW